MQIDYHTHHARCGHADGSLEQYVQHAIDTGLQQLGLSDHMPLLHVDPEQYLPDMAMPMDELPKYVEECLYLKEKYKHAIDIRVGLEGDYIEGYEETIRSIVEGYPWDYVIGSVHFLGEWDLSDHRQIDRWERSDIDEVYERYYDAVQKAAGTGFYDFIGHLDVAKRFGFRPDRDPAPLEEAALDAIAEADMAIELNASGWSKPVKEAFPSERILASCLKRAIPVTLGSDAHRPEHLERDFDKARSLLKNIGFQQIATFSARTRIMIPL